MAVKKKGAAAKAKSVKTLNLDFSKEEQGGGRRPRFPEGDYKVKIVKIMRGDSSDKGTPYIGVFFRMTEGKRKGKEFEERFYVTNKSLWRIRALLEAAGIDVPEKKKLSIPTAKLMGKTVGVTLGDDEYKGRTSSRVTDVLDPDDLSDIEDGDEDDDTEDDFDPSSAQLEELVKYNKANKLGVKGLSKMKLKKARKVVASAMEDNDDGEMEDVDLDDM